MHGAAAFALAAAVAAAAAGSATASPIYCVTSVSSAAAPESTSHASYGAGSPSTSEGSSNSGDSSSSTAHASTNAYSATTTSVASYGGAGPSYSSASATQHSYSYTVASSSASPAVTLPPVPAGLGYEDSAPVNTSVLPFVDYAGTNRRDDACYVNISTNAGVRVLDQYLKIWMPTTLIVDAGVTLAADGSCPAVVATNWSGIPSVAPYGGTIVNLDLHYHNLNVSAKHTANRTAEQALAAYLDDRRNKGYSITDGMGPLTSLWRTLSGSNTSITTMPADAVNKSYSDSGTDIGLTTAQGNTLFGAAVDFINQVGGNASTEPAKRFYKYARPFRWTSEVVVLPQLVPTESSTPVTDGGFPSGHTAEATRKAFMMAYLVPQRFQEMIARALELGENRIFAGMHDPLDVIGGHLQSTAFAAAVIANGGDTGMGPAAYANAQAQLI
ncbi:hypothetical protein HK405_003182, partial [Cladochytrium tenue]